MARGNDYPKSGDDRFPRLVAINGSSRREYRLACKRITIGGGDDNTIVLDDPTISRRHAEIRIRRGRCAIRDLKSTNGTFVNDRRIGEPVDLKAGDTIRFAAMRFEYSPAALPRRPGRVAAFTMGLLLAAIAVAAYVFMSNWTVAEQAEDYLAIASPYPTPPMVAVAAAASRKNETEHATPTVGVTPTPRAPHRAIAHAPHPASTVSARIRATVRKTPTPASLSRASTDATPSARPTSAATVAAASPTIAPGWPTPVPRPPPSAASDWLGVVNAYRSLARLEPVAEDPKLSTGDLAHARYIVKNYREQIIAGYSLGAAMHTEDRSKPFYSAAGLDAARSSDVNELDVPHGTVTKPSWAIDSWITAPFHRINILNPGLRKVGYGAYCEQGACVAALNTIGGAAPMSAEGSPYDQPVAFPPSASEMDLRELAGEWPNPITSCAGYSEPSGLPITLQLGSNIDARLTSFSLTPTSGDSVGIAEHVCGFDSDSYTNPAASAQQRAREILRSQGAVVIVPQNPLLRGIGYRVAVTVNGKQYSWSFSTAP